MSEIDYNQISLDNIAHGAAKEAFEYELQKVMANIADPNTDAKAKRKITLEFTYSPTEDRAAATVAIQCKSKLAPNKEAEDLILHLQTHFVETEQRNALLKICSNLTSEKIITSRDDGFSQEITTRKNVSLKEKVKVENPILLEPFRTFREIEQPGSPFIFRLHDRGEGRLPSVSLSMADADTWKLQAMLNIKVFLDHRLGQDLKIPIIL